MTLRIATSCASGPWEATGDRRELAPDGELVEVIDQVFDSFHKVNNISKSMLGPRKPSAKNLDKLK